MTFQQRTDTDTLSSFCVPVNESDIRINSLQAYEPQRKYAVEVDAALTTSDCTKIASEHCDRFKG